MHLHFWQVSVWMQILLLTFVSVLVPNWPFSNSHRFYIWIHLWLFWIHHRDDRLNLNLPQNTYFRAAVHYPLIRDAVDRELSENKKNLNWWMGLKDLDFGSGSSILLTEHSDRQPLCLDMVTSTKNQCCKTAVVKINIATYTCRVWHWREKKRLKRSWKFWKQHHWTSWRQNQIHLFKQPAEKEDEGGLYCSLQFSKKRLLAPWKTQRQILS